MIKNTVNLRYIERDGLYHDYIFKISITLPPKFIVLRN